MKELDCQGMVCPKPVLTCKEVLETEHPESLHVLVDNLAAQENVSRFLKRHGYAVTSVKEHDKLWHVNAENCGCEITEPEPTPTAESSKILVLITTETLGRGDDMLGTKLMENFLATLQELGSDLWMVVLLNGGVKLAAKDGKSLESLKALAASGTAILVCGTCLNHYGLLEAKKVGETTNMLDIVTSLSLATKVIRP